MIAVVRVNPTGEVGDVTGPVVGGQQLALQAGLGPEGPGLALRAGEEHNSHLRLESHSLLDTAVGLAQLPGVNVVD